MPGLHVRLGRLSRKGSLLETVVPLAELREPFVEICRHHLHFSWLRYVHLQC